MLTVMFVGLALVAAAALPVWPHSRAWGYVPAAGIALVLLLLVAMHMMYMI